MTTGPGVRFHSLQPFWPELFELGHKAEQAAAHEPELTAIKLRGLTEAMVSKLFSHLELPYDTSKTHFDRLVHLESLDLLDARLLAKFHAVRKLGNKAAHNGSITQTQVDTLLDDAWSLSSWFCCFIKPEMQPAADTVQRWDTGSNDENSESVRRQPTIHRGPSKGLGLPEEHVRRIHEQVSRAMAAVDPRVRQLRTSITLQEAFTEQLSSDQMACLDELSAFLGDPTKRIFLLKGYAGTGKTFLIKGITEYLAAQGRAFRLAAPTGRAAKVISEKTGRDARTLHSQIYNFGDLREYAAEDEAPGSETFKFYAQIGSNPDQANNVYIVDEASLLSDVYSESEFFRSGTGYLLHDFVSYVGFDHGETDRKIIFVGDPAQLPPVGMSTSPALDEEYIRKHLGLAAVGYELKEVLRQQADSGVIRNVMPIREAISNHSFGSLRFDFDTDVHPLRADEFLPSYLAACSAEGAGTPIVITGSNSEAADLNRTIRNALFPGQDFVVPADRLIVMANAFVDGTFVANGEFVDVVDADTMVEQRSVSLRTRNDNNGAVEILQVPLVFREVRLALMSPDGPPTVVTVKILDDYLHGRKAGLEASHQRALYVDFLRRHPHLKHPRDRDVLGLILRKDPYFNALRVRFGYTVTCHKAQGGEWEQVFVSCTSGQNPRSAGYFRWLYTAMTRSSAKLYLIDHPKVMLQPVGPPTDLGEGGDAQDSHTAVSSKEAFRMEVLSRVRQATRGTGIEIDDVAHHQYQEAFYFRHELGTARVNLSYNGRNVIKGISIPADGPLNNRLHELLAPLVGQSIGVSEGNTAHSTDQPLSRPFLREFHDRLLPILEVSGIKVVDLKEQAWCQRYSFRRGKEVAVVDIFYDGRDRLKSCMPVMGKHFNSPGSALLPEVMTILTTQVIL